LNTRLDFSFEAYNPRTGKRLPYKSPTKALFQRFTQEIEYNYQTNPRLVKKKVSLCFFLPWERIDPPSAVKRSIERIGTRLGLNLM
jgi:hypothetical protein